MTREITNNENGKVSNLGIRQPIVTVAGHVDHGKTSILDSIRGTCVYDSEAGGITQKISFTSFPVEKIKARCPLLEKNKAKLDIPGFLFIDTPGHAAFSNLRKRGGALADLAILVIDISEGIMPQTAEVMNILKLNKTPFVIALNKVDKISGWRKQSDSIVESINMQSMNTKNDYIEKLLTLEGSLHAHGFNALPFYEITDYTKNLAMVPCSARTGEGIAELIMTLCGLSQKFLKERLKLGKEAKGVILEVKKEKTINYMEAILYDGEINSTEEIAIGSFGEPIIGKIRILEEIVPISCKFKTAKKVHAATGIRIQLADPQDVMPGMPFQTYHGNKADVVKEFKKLITEKIQVDDEGIIVKADSLGSLEALIVLLKEAGIKICKAGIGNIDKRDVISANTNLQKNELDAIILGFNVQQEEEIKEVMNDKIKIFHEDVVYKLIEKVQEYRHQKRMDLEREQLLKLSPVVRLKILHNFVFRNSNPAVFGIKVEAGKLRSRCTLMNEQGEEISDVKNIQADKEAVEEANTGMEVAISLPGVNYERQIKELEYLYSDISENQYREFKKNKDLLSREEIDVLQKIAQIRRAKNPTWGV